MTSGVKWNEDYTDPKSDVARMFIEPVPAGPDPTVAYMRKLPREAAPGTKWVYKTGETNLIGVLVERATGKPLATYLSEKMWKPFGMERDAFWMVDPGGMRWADVACRCPARLCADGELVLGGGSGRIVPDGWFAEATASRSAEFPISPGGYGYGFQWWVFPGRPLWRARHFRADHHRRSEDACRDRDVSAWPKATGKDLSAKRNALLAKFEAAVEITYADASLIEVVLSVFHTVKARPTRPVPASCARLTIGTPRASP